PLDAALIDHRLALVGKPPEQLVAYVERRARPPPLREAHDDLGHPLVAADEEGVAPADDPAPARETVRVRPLILPARAGEDARRPVDQAFAEPWHRCLA